MKKVVLYIGLLKGVKDLMKKITAVFMSLVLFFSFGAAPAKATQETDDTIEAMVMTVAEYRQLLAEEGYPALTTDRYLKIAGFFTDTVRLLTGQILKPKKHFNVTTDDVIKEISEYALERSGFDMEKVLHRLPDINKPAEFVVNTFNLDTTELRNYFYTARDEAYENGDGMKGGICHFLGVYMSIIELCELYAVPVGENGEIYEIMMRFTYKDGTQEAMSPGIYINTVTGECTNRDDSGMCGIGFNFNLEEMTMYATVGCWMRNFGFCLFYDVSASTMPYFFNYNTRRFKFDYDGREWMIQIWKGNYVITNGAEVGLYSRDAEKSGTYYDCATDEQMLEMSMQVYAGDKLLVNKPLQKHWWINGFNLSGRMYLPSTLTLKFSIVMPDEDMLQAFCESMDNHYRKDVTYTVDELTVNVVW